jgi:hypothetical protein
MLPSMRSHLKHVGLEEEFSSQGYMDKVLRPALRPFVFLFSYERPSLAPISNSIPSTRVHVRFRPFWRRFSCITLP